MGGEPWHLYQTTLFAMYVDYDNGKVRLSAALGVPANASTATAIRILNAGGGTGNRTSVFIPETDFAAKWHPILSKRPDSLWTPAFFHFFGRAFHKWTRGTGQGKKCGFYSDFEMNIDPVSSRS